MINQPDIANFRCYFEEYGWKIKLEETRASRDASYRNAKNLELYHATRQFLDNIGGNIYSHQYDAISRYLHGTNIIITTPTASGKTLIFNTCAIEMLSRSPNACIVAIYPLKALASRKKSGEMLFSVQGLMLRWEK